MHGSGEGEPPALRTHLLVACGFALLALAVTAPLATCQASCLGPSYDPLVTMWSFGWISHAIFGGRDGLFDANLFHPYPLTLALGESSLTNALLMAPAVALSQNPILGHNLALLLNYFLAGFGTYLLAIRLTRHLGAALFAGTAFAAAPFLVHNAYNLQSLACAFVPWLILAADRFCASPSWREGVALWGAATALALASINLAVYGGLPAIVYIVVHTWISCHDLRRAHFLAFVAVAPPFLAITAWAYSPYWTWHTGFGLARSLGEVEASSAHWKTYYSVAKSNLLHRLTGLYVGSDLNTSPGFVGGTVIVLAVVGVVAAVRARRGTAPRIFAVGWAPLAMTLFALLMSFGPSVVVAGSKVPLPYRLLFALPGLSGLRTPNRFAGMVALGCCLLAALGLTYANGRLKYPHRLLLGGVVGVLLALELATFPSSGAAMRYPDGLSAQRRAALAWIMQQPDTTRLLEVPLDRDDLLYDAALNGRRYINGFSSYEPPLYRELAVALAEFPAARARSLIRHLPVDYVIADTARFSPKQSVALEAAPELESVVNFGTIRILRVKQHRSSLDALMLSARTSISDDDQVVLEVKNPSAEALPLYPLHSVRAAARHRERSGQLQTCDLPLWLMPGEFRELVLDVPGSVVELGETRVEGVINVGRTTRTFTLAPKGHGTN